LGFSWAATGTTAEMAKTPVTAMTVLSFRVRLAMPSKHPIVGCMCFPPSVAISPFGHCLLYAGALDRRADIRGNGPKIVQGMLRGAMAGVNCQN
jgi:hypothetical protein